MDYGLSKCFLRQKYRWIREIAKSPEKDDKICKLFIESDYYKNADIIFLYYSVRYETDTLKLINTALKDGKRVALPKCICRDKSMEFYFIESLDESITEGMYSLKEPNASLCEKAYFTADSLCVVPGMAFDKTGCRLGYGGGYYDRFLVDFTGKTVGLCYHECFCDELICEPHDISVDIVITDKKIHEFR